MVISRKLLVLKMSYFLLFANWSKLMTSGLPAKNRTEQSTIIDEPTDLLNRSQSLKNENNNNNNNVELRPVDDITTNMLKKDTQSELELKSSDEIHIDNLLNMVQNEMDESEDTKKTQYIDLLKNINERFNENAQKAKVFFKNVWRTVNFGVLGSSQRQRSKEKARGMLQLLSDLWTWLCRRIFNVATWFKPNGSEKEVENLSKLDHEEKLKLLETHSKQREDYYSTAAPENSSEKKN